LVDEDEYMLQLSRYIHRNPIEMKRPLVQQLSSWHWSSYPAYINKAKPEDWLYRQPTYDMLGHRQRYVRYKDYVEQGNDEDIQRFYGKGNMASILGGKAFREEVYSTRIPVQDEAKLKALNMRPTITDIIMAVAKEFDVTTKRIRGSVKGKQKENIPRKLAMYLSQKLGDIPLKQIAEYFHLKHVGSASVAIYGVKEMLKEGQFKNEVDSIYNLFNIR